jgi:tRNA pseudouridine13 synthase
VSELGRRLGISRDAIFFAGTKDKRAVTTQYVSLRAPEEEVRALDIKDVDILETRRVDRAPKIGELVGNRFTVRVRGVPEDSPDSIEATLARIEREGGFPNYFGVQRFGVQRPITHLVGEQIVRGNLAEAVRLYVGNPLPSEQDDSRAARQFWEETRDAAAALDRYPWHMSFERSMLDQLAKRPDDYEGALMRLPSNLRTMFVYAAQSVLFNRIVARRLSAGLGLNEPVEGDLVFGVDAEGLPDKDRLHKVDSRNRERIAKLCREGKALVTGSIFGMDAALADGPMGEIERDVIAEAGYTRDDFRVVHLPEVSSFGTRRELLAPLGPVRWSRGEDATGAFVELSFFLLKGTYATCLLREVMKTEAAAYA